MDEFNRDLYTVPWWSHFISARTYKWFCRFGLHVPAGIHEESVKNESGKRIEAITTKFFCQMCAKELTGADFYRFWRRFR